MSARILPAKDKGAVRAVDNNRLRAVVVVGIIFGLAFVAYFPVISAGFVWDDNSFLLNNPNIQATDGLARIWRGRETSDYYPVTLSLLWLEWRLWGVSAAGYHVVNILTHALGAALLWRLLRRLQIPGAWLAAAVFVAHPVNAASVAWITEHKNTLSLVFLALALLCYFRHENHGRRGAYFMALALYVLALLSKVSTATLPVIILLCAWWRRNRITRDDLVRVAPFFLLAIIAAFVAISFQQDKALLGHKVGPENIWMRIAIAGKAAPFYLSKAVFPFGLATVYPKWPAETLSPTAVISALALPALLLILWLDRRGEGKGPFFALTYFVIALSPTLGFFDMAYMRYSYVADWFQYLAIIGIIALVAGAAVSGARLISGMKKNMLQFAAGSAVIALAVMTAFQAGKFRNDATLWKQAIANDPHNWVAFCNMSKEAQIQADNPPKKAREGELGDGELAISYANHALALTLGDARAGAREAKESGYLDSDIGGIFFNRGTAYDYSGRLAEAIADFTTFIEIMPESPDGYLRRGMLFIQDGKPNLAIVDIDKSISFMEMRLWEGSATRESVARKMAEAYLRRGAAKSRMGDYTAAVADYSTSLSWDEKSAPAYFNRGVALDMRGELKQAVANYTKAVELQPDMTDAWFNRGFDFYDLGDYRTAADDFSRAINLNDEDAIAYLRRARCYIKLGRRDQARADLAACRSLGQDIPDDVLAQMEANE